MRPACAPLAVLRELPTTDGVARQPAAELCGVAGELPMRSNYRTGGSSTGNYPVMPLLRLRPGILSTPAAHCLYQPAFSIHLLIHAIHHTFPPRQPSTRPRQRRYYHARLHLQPSRIGSSFSRLSSAGSGTCNLAHAVLPRPGVCRLLPPRPTPKKSPQELGSRSQIRCIVRVGDREMDLGIDTPSLRE